MKSGFTCALTVVGAVAVCEAAYADSEMHHKEKPNIILFYVDDLGWMDLSCQGSKFYETPNIDKLAADGLTFTNAYTAHPRCLPARYALLTGRYPGRGLFTPKKGDGGLKPEDVTVAEALHAGGYKTFFIGKWHEIGKYGEANTPRNQGFDIALGGGAPGSPPTYFYPYRKIKLNQKKLSGKDALGLNGNIIPDLGENGTAGEYLTDRITAETVKFIQRQVESNPAQPFYAHICHYGVHTPFEAKPEVIEKYRRKLKNMRYDSPEFIKDPRGGDTKMRQDDPVYAAMIESVDDSVGAIRKLLKELGIADNTLILFFSDNGGLADRGKTSRRRLATSNYPLKTGKGWLYEGGIREPMFVCWPGKIKAGTKTDVPVVTTDIYPTFLDVAGLPLRPKDHMDGYSFAPLLFGKEYRRPKPIFWHSPSARPYSTGDYNASAVRDGKYKLIDWYQDGKVELFDLSNDIGEKHNVAEEYPEVTAKLLKELRDWKKAVNAGEYPLRLTKPRKKRRH